MAVETTETRIEYLGDGAATEFSFPFPVLEKSHLAVAAATDAGADAGYAEGADYTVALSASALGEAYAAVVTLSQPLPAGWTLAITRAVPLTQQTRLRNHEGFFPEAVEKSLDKLTMIDQQQQGLIDRALKAPPGSVPEELLESLMAAGERIDGVESAVAGLNSVKADKTELAAETTARQQADAALAAAKADKTALAAETTARISGDDSLSSALATETTARQNADSALAASKADKTDLAAETTARQNADAALTTAVAATYATKTEVSTGLAGKAGLTHAPQHAAAGADPVTPAAIGAVATNDSRLSDARTPTAHKASHATGGSDAITPASIGAVATNDS
ncbi:MAG: hypothetical protein LBT97_07405, partial [Planctomycetota bacterium]|nr:hypothetical protein [Planctomycetota bacterium]